MRLILFMTMVGFVNCTTFFNRSETRVSPICAFGNEKVKALDYSLTKAKKYPKNSKVEKLIGKIQEYEKLKQELIDLQIQSEEITKTLASLQDRIDAIRITLGTREEKEGDLYAGQYNFVNAIESYTEALNHLEFVDEKNKAVISPLERIQKKISVTKENGENFLNNRIKSLIDQAIYLNLDDQTSKAKEAMKQAEKELESSIFTNPKIESLYIEQAKVMNLYDKEIESTCTSKISIPNGKRKTNSLPETFRTKSGIEFTKVIRKDGSPVYVSERIRPDKSDSWYFARDYAERLNREENCPDCYQLPEVEDVQSETWLRSWSPAPYGVTAGNFCLFVYPCFIYTIDFVHDVITHPLTWQSYIYLISPDRGHFWKSHTRSFRSAGSDNWFLPIGRSNKGFRLVRSLR